MPKPTAPARYYGDPSKPGYPTPEQIAEWNRVADCDHVLGFRDETCARCGAVLRSITTTEGWADHWAEQRADEAAYIPD